MEEEFQWWFVRICVTFPIVLGLGVLFVWWLDGGCK